MIDRAAIEPLGDGAARWPRDPSSDARAIVERLRRVPRVVDVVVTERHVMVTFDPRDPPDLDRAKDEPATRAMAARPPRVVAIRARYDGPDIAEVAARAALSEDDVADLHAGRAYTVAMIGFLPGFAYLRDVDPRIAPPRRASPRPRIDAGAIGVAGAYTGVYPFASPGGWNVIARAIDFAPFSPDEGALLAPGDEVRFVRA